MLTHQEGTTQNPPDLIVQVHRVALAWAKRRMNYDAANDVAADVAMNILRRGGIDLAALSDRGELDRFVITAARNAFRSRSRSERRRASYEAACAAEPGLRHSYGTAADDRCDYRDLIETVQTAFGHVRRCDRNVFLRVTEGTMTYAAIGAEFGISARKVEWITRCTRLTMQQHLSEYRAAALAIRAKRGRGEQ